MLGGGEVVDEDIRDDGIFSVKLEEVGFKMGPLNAGVEYVLCFDGGGEAGLAEDAIEHVFEFVVGAGEVASMWTSL